MTSVDADGDAIYSLNGKTVKTKFLRLRPRLAGGFDIVDVRDNTVVGDSGVLVEGIVQV